MEVDALPLLDGRRLPVAVPDHPIYDGSAYPFAIADFAYPVVKLDIECDSVEHHSSPLDVARDKRRDRRLAALGWTVLRFTTMEIRRETDRVISDIRNVLKRLGHPEVA